MTNVRGPSRAGFLLLAGCLAATAVPGVAAALTLPQVLGEVLRGNPELAMRRWELEASRARAVRAGSWESPMAEVGVENVPTTGRYDTDPMTMKQVGLSQRVPVFGANRLARRAGEAQVATDLAALDALALERCGEAWESYTEAWDAGARAHAAERHQGVMQRMVDAARMRYESGRSRLEDLLRTQAEQAEVTADVVTWRADEATALARLAALRGAHADSAGGGLEAPPDVDAGVSPAPWVQSALRHPRVAEQEAQAHRFRLEAQAARRAAWPDLELSGSYGFRETLRVPAHGITEEQDNMFSAHVGFAVPVFAATREHADARAMEAMANAADAGRTAASLGLEQELVAAHARARAGARMVRLLADTVRVAQQRALDAAWNSYTAGSGDLSNVLEAAHMLYAEDLRETRERVALYQALGRLVVLGDRLDLVGVALPDARRPR